MRLSPVRSPEIGDIEFHEATRHECATAAFRQDLRQRRSRPSRKAARSLGPLGVWTSPDLPPADSRIFGRPADPQKPHGRARIATIDFLAWCGKDPFFPVND